MLKKAVLAFFNHDRSEVNSVRSHNFNELGLVEIGGPSLDRTQGIEKRVFQHPAKVFLEISMPTNDSTYFSLIPILAKIRAYLPKQPFGLLVRYDATLLAPPRAWCPKGITSCRTETKKT